MKRRFFALLAALMCLLCGCDVLPESSDPVSDGGAVTDTPTEGLQAVALAYSHDDTLNPYAAKTAVNAQLTGLLYDSLTVLNDYYVPQLSLASAVTLSDPTHVVATLRTGAVFSDGSAVTAADVVSSFTEAKKSARYAPLLANVTSAKADSKKGTVTFTLSAADPNAAACLSFPVVKISTLTTAAGMAPLGGGLYRYESTDNGHQLAANPHAAVAPHYATVALRHLPNHSARHYALASGEISYYYNDLSEGDLPRIVGANKAVPMNAMVYIGINSTRAVPAQAMVRQALSALVDRTAVCSTAYAEWATPSAQPFTPQWQGMSGLTATPVRDVDGAATLLETAGYPVKNGKRLELELIYSTDRADRARVADAIRIQMEDAGVAIIPVPLSEAEYRARLTAGNYDLYIAEIHLTADMSLRPLLAGGAASYGISRSGAAATAYGQYLSGAATLEQLLTAFAADMPYIPLCWRSGLAAYDRRLTTVTPTGQDPYSGFADWQ